MSDEYLDDVELLEIAHILVLTGAGFLLLDPPTTSAPLIAGACIASASIGALQITARRVKPYVTS